MNMNTIATVFRRFHGTRCIISNMNDGRDMNAIKHIISEANRQKLEARIITLEYTVTQLCEKIKKLETIDINSSIQCNATKPQSIYMVQDCKHVN